MAFGTVEVSEFDGAPIELYHFQRGVASWFYTSYDEPVTFAANTYIPVPLRRSAIEAIQDVSKNSVKLRTTRRLDFAQQYIANVPSDTVVLTITRMHAGDLDPAIVWRGRVVNVKHMDDEVEIVCQSIYSSLKRPGLRRLYQINCPHILYGPQCQVPKNTVQIITTLTGATGVTLTSPDFIIAINPLYNPTWLSGGSIEINTAGLIDRRFIVNHDNAGGVLTINLPAPTMQVGSIVTAFPGCPHSLAACDEKFNNSENYGGFPYIPGKNPMNGTPVF